MTDDPGGNRPRHRINDTRFKWIVVASLFALAMILGTIQDLVK